MSSLKQMPNEKRMRALRYFAWFFLIAVMGGLVYLRFFFEPDAGHARYALKALLIVGIILAFAINYYFSKLQRCPDCRRSMRAVDENLQPKAGDNHLLYCKDCDILWDTTVPKSNA